MAIDIHKISVRNSLEPRREPYWGAPLDKGRHLGVRKLANGNCIWVAKLRDEDGRQRTRALGQATKDFDYGAAKREAEKWFAEFEIGVVDKPPTVADACREYVKALEADGRGATAKGDRRKDPNAVPGWGAAHDAEMRFRRLVYDADIGKVRLDKLRAARLREWRNAVPGSKDSQNRNWEALRAALRLAITNRRVHPALAEEIRAVKKHKNAKQRRTLYLDLEQRRALLAAADGAIRNLIEAAMLTGARPGELVSMKRGAFDARTKTATFKGKTGSRDVPLSDAATALFIRLSKGKLPSARMLTRDDGEPWAHSGWDEGVREAARKAGLPPGVTLYTLRHSWITQALMAGTSTLDVARLTGTSLQMIEEHYGHLVLDAARERLAKVVMV